MSKHTPEPWVYVPGPGGGTVEDVHGGQIAVISGQAPLRGNPEIPIEEIQGANGRLMALAPEMAVMLHDYIYLHEQDTYSECVCMHCVGARALLAKLDGES